MTPDERFEKWWFGAGTDEEKPVARSAYFAATRATALRCVEICTGVSKQEDSPYSALADDCADAITKEFGL